MTKKYSEIEEVKEILKSRIEQVEELQKQLQSLQYENLKQHNRIDALLAVLVLTNKRRNELDKAYYFKLLNEDNLALAT